MRAGTARAHLHGALAAIEHSRAGLGMGYTPVVIPAPGCGRAQGKSRGVLTITQGLGATPGGG